MGTYGDLSYPVLGVNPRCIRGMTIKQHVMAYRLYQQAGLSLGWMRKDEIRYIDQLVRKGYANYPSATWARLTDEGNAYIRSNDRVWQEICTMRAYSAPKGE